MESNRQAAKEAIQETMDRLKEVVPRSRLDEPLTLNAITPYEQTFQSTFGREVSYFVYLRYMRAFICVSGRLESGVRYEHCGVMFELMDESMNEIADYLIGFLLY